MKEKTSASELLQKIEYELDRIDGLQLPSDCRELLGLRSALLFHLRNIIDK